MNKKYRINTGCGRILLWMLVFVISFSGLTYAKTPSETIRTFYKAVKAGKSSSTVLRSCEKDLLFPSPAGKSYWPSLKKANKKIRFQIVSAKKRKSSAVIKVKVTYPNLMYTHLFALDALAESLPAADEPVKDLPVSDETQTDLPSSDDTGNNLPASGDTENNLPASGNQGTDLPASGEPETGLSIEVSDPARVYADSFRLYMTPAQWIPYKTVTAVFNLKKIKGKWKITQMNGAAIDSVTGGFHSACHEWKLDLRERDK